MSAFGVAMTYPPKLGIIAGAGDLPVCLAQSCQERQLPYFVLALRGHADAGWLSQHPHAWVQLGSIGEVFSLLKKSDVREVVLAGAVRRPSFSDLELDWRGAKLLATLSLKALGDDGLLRVVVAEFEKEGFRVIGAHDVLGSVMAPAGVLGDCVPDEQAWRDIWRGIDVVRSLGKLDVGQGAVVQQGIVLAVEASEGTDAMLQRCVALKKGGDGGVLVKLCKPSQDQRVDLPTLGPKTVQAAHIAGIRGIAFSSKTSILVDESLMVGTANSLGIFLVGLNADEVLPT